MDKLKETRLKYLLSMKQISQLLKISPAYYCQIENNKRTLSYKLALKIAGIFNLKPDDLFYDDIKKLDL